MGLKDNTIKLLGDNQIKLKDNYDQHFLVDEDIIEKLVQSAKIQEGDIVLEIGPGLGYITKELSLKAKNVIAVELDEQFKQILNELPENVDVNFDDAISSLTKQKFKAFDIIVANIPYQIGEPLMHYLCTAKQVRSALLLVPKRFANKMIKNPIFSAFLTITVLHEVSKEAFYPIPDVASAIIRISHRPDFDVDNDEEAFVRRKLYLQEGKILKNGLREVIIDLHAVKHNKRMTKKEANSIIESLDLNMLSLVKIIKDISLEDYSKIARKVVSLDI